MFNMMMNPQMQQRFGQMQGRFPQMQQGFGQNRFPPQGGQFQGPPQGGGPNAMMQDPRRHPTPQPMRRFNG